MAKKPVTVEELADYALITDVTSYGNELAGTPAELAEKVLLTDVTYFDDSSEVESGTEDTEDTNADTPGVDTHSAEDTTADDAPVDTPSTEGAPEEAPAEDTHVDSKI